MMKSARLPATASLLYWLLLVAGLAGVTLVRLDEPEVLAPLWLGSVPGVALGLLLGWARFRAWLAFGMMVGVLALSAAVLGSALDPSFRTVETAVCAFLPAAVCGYLALSERGALLAFWYPAVSWMVALLDRPGRQALDARAVALLVSGLAALFVAFLRARETRRVALWQTYASDRLAEARPPSILRRAPLRAASEWGWTLLLGAGALVLTAWVAPHLWGREGEKTGGGGASAEVAARAGIATCCPERAVEVPRDRVREYFPLLNWHDEGVPEDAPTCVPCAPRAEMVAASGDVGQWSSDVSSGGQPPAFTKTPTTTAALATAAPSTTAAPAAKSATTTAPATKSAPTTATPSTPTHASSLPPRAPVSSPSAAAPLVVALPEPAPIATEKITLAVVPVSSAPREEPAEPWKWLLGLSLFGVVAHVGQRAIRRHLTLRHLARPFWRETAGQRMSNHWQLMRIGLKDAGWQFVPGEQPQELARRVGIEGVGACATLLDRARHGVRLEASDLDSMEKGARAVYEKARSGAGFGARVVSWLRWPLA